MSSGLYHEDFYAWAMHNAAAIRERRFSDSDAEHIAEELESMGRAERRALVNRLAVLMAHLLKWQFQPDRRSRSWRHTVDVQRDEVLDLLEESPSLKHEIGDMIGKAYRKASRLAALETGLAVETFPETCPYELDQLLDEAFWPEWK